MPTRPFRFGVSMPAIGSRSTWQAKARQAEDQIRRLPNVLAGPPAQLTDTLHRYRETYGLSYFSVREEHMTDFAKVMAHLR
ncbi:hypothetical protein [Streptomyces sp. NPDC058155]|uniref:hypothetical protein n=1 Tax=Streptomyces sp. NPDC058155 TaxID=3346359 RepID=UPI0036F05F4E